MRACRNLSGKKGQGDAGGSRVAASSYLGRGRRKANATGAGGGLCRSAASDQVPLPAASSNDPPRFKLRNGIIVSPDLTLVAVGRTPNVEALALDKVGLPSSGFVPVNEQMRTKVPSIFAIGDLNGIMLLDSAAYDQARVAIQTILGRPARFDAHWIKRCLHTQPPIAAAGLTEAEANTAGQDVGGHFGNAAVNNRRR